MQSNLLKRNCQDHNNKQVFLACYNKYFKEKRQVCQINKALHSAHPENLIDDEKVQESQSKCKQLIKQLNDKFNELTLFYKELISSIETNFYNLIEKLNGFKNDQFNQLLNQLIIQDDQQLNLTQTLDDGFKYCQDKIIQCQNEFNLKELKYIQITKEIEKKALFYHKQGYDYYDKDDFANAIKQFDLALDLNQNHLESLFYKGESLRLMGNKKESIEWYDKALLIDPKYIDGLRCKGESLRLMKQHKESIEWYDKALQIDPKYVHALYGKGDSLRQMNQYKESIQWYDRALQIDPKYVNALFGKGDSLRMLSQLTQALQFLDSALQIDKNYEQALAIKGACLIDLNKYDEAEICLNKAIKLAPNDQWNKNQLKKLQDKRNQ